MGRKYFIVGTFFGIQLRIDYSWFIIFALISWTVITSYLPAYHQGLTAAEQTVGGLIVTLLFFASVIAHEYAHSLVANRRGLKIKRITLFVFGGASELHHEPEDPKTELLMTAAGPLTSLAIAGIFAIFWQLGEQLDLTALAVICQPVAALNLVVAIFNLLPAFPLDGGRILRSILWLTRKDFQKATRSATNAGIVLSYLMIGIGLLEVFAGYLIGGLWFAIIGFFLNQAARFSYSQTLHDTILAGLKTRDVMSKKAITVPTGTMLDNFLNDYVLRHKQYDFVVVNGKEKPTGIIELSRVTRTGRSESQTTIDDYTEPLSKELVLKENDSAAKAFRLMQSHNLDILPVVAGRTLTGVVMRRYLEDYVTIHRMREPGGAL